LRAKVAKVSLERLRKHTVRKLQSDLLGCLRFAFASLRLAIEAPGSQILCLQISALLSQGHLNTERVLAKVWISVHGSNFCFTIAETLRDNTFGGKDMKRLKRQA
jgi:hypothetical protein